VSAGIYAFEQNAVHRIAHVRNTSYETNAIFVAEFARVLLHAAAAFFDVGAAALECNNNSCAWYMVGRGGVVQRARESNRMRCVRTDDAKPKIGGKASTRRETDSRK
jgi:hypothetical protein